jgi:hypothetical protein
VKQAVALLAQADSIGICVICARKLVELENALAIEHFLLAV